MAPPECLVAVDEEVEEHTAPPELRAPCEQPTRDEWVRCVVEKARKLAELKELDRQDKRIERERRRACARFIEGG